MTEPSEVQALAAEIEAAWQAWAGQDDPPGEFHQFAAARLHARGVRVAPSPTEDAGRWSRGGWHDGPCWREWINNPEGGCTCGR